MNGFKLNLSVVPDPTDFPPPSEAPGLRALDAALRCEICGENFDAPVVLPCGHSFCSLCVRQSLKERKGCPNCRKAVNEFQLARNLALEQTVEQWNSARPYILQLIKRRSTPKRASKEKSNSPKQQGSGGKKRKDVIVVDHSPYKRRKPSPDETPIKPHKSMNVDNGGESETMNEPGPSSPLRSIDHVPTSDVEEQEVELNEDGMVSCPICSKTTRSDRINEHLDSGCNAIYSSKGGPSKGAESKRAWLGIFQSGANGSVSDKGKGKARATESPEDEDERLPKPAYDVLKEKGVREMLQKHSLPTTGNKQTLVTRHERYVMLYNANLDRSKQNRKSASELRKEALKWEQLRDTKKPAAISSREYEVANKAQFQALAAAARKTRSADKHTSVQKDAELVAESNHDTVSIVLDSEGEM